MTPLVYCLLTQQYKAQAILTNRLLVLSILIYQDHEIKRHIEIRSYGRISPQVDYIFGEVAYRLIKTSNNGRLIPYPLAYAKKIADNVINKTITKEINQRLKEKLFCSCSDLEQLRGNNEFFASPEYHDFCFILEAFKNHDADKHQLVVWHFIEERSDRQISQDLYGSSVGKDYDRTRQQIKRAKDSFINFSRKIWRLDSE